MNAILHFTVRAGRALAQFCLLMLVIASGRPAFAVTPDIDIANMPLFTGRRDIVPNNLLLSLSVDLHSVGAAYRGMAYDKTREFAGYFNPAKCYIYSTATGNAAASAYFQVSGPADTKADTNHECSSAFSGNFLNWAATSTLDLLRYGLTGGDRIVDQIDTTVLQRAVLPDSFYADATWFPRRTISSADGGNVSDPTKVTPFTKVTKIYITSCSNKILFSSTDPSTGGTNCASTKDAKGNQPVDRNLGVGDYLVRVKVCDSNDGSTRTDLCQQFGANYKPVGSLQRNAGQTRFAVMSYLADPTQERYGGVLRSPMKFIGPKKYDAPAYAEAQNDKKEWDPGSGVLFANPDGSTSSSTSGLINFINQFGRSGNYRAWDPVGELYYEGLRYLQAKAPTSNAASGTLTATMTDGFPVLTSWTDPLVASCKRPQIVLFADAQTNWDFYLPGNTRTAINNGAYKIPRPAAAPGTVAPATGQVADPNVATWTATISAMEVDTGRTYTNPAPDTTLTNLDTRDTGYLNYASYYLSGLAYWANTQAIRTDLPVKVKTSVVDFDEGGNGTLNGTGRTPIARQSQLYLAAKYGGFEDANGDGNPYKTTLADGSAVSSSNTEWDSNSDGIPDSYYLASQPGTLIQAARTVIPPRVRSTSSGTIAGAAISGTRLSPAVSYLYQPGFDGTKWSGSLTKRQISVDAANNLVIGPVLWDAGGLLTGEGGAVASPTPTQRNIYTANLTNASTLQTVKFDWNSLNNENQTALNMSPSTGNADTFGTDRVDYLRGSRSKESGYTASSYTGIVFRSRSRVLGDIVNSNAVYVGAPATNISGSAYQTFYTNHIGRTPVVYVGANDGMLHAFAADTGAELFAYIPHMLVPRLNLLSAPEYVHRPYVDGGIAVAEARIGTTWKTVLAAGMGGGAQGVFALDVSNPADYTASPVNFSGGGGVLFEFSDSDDADMGNLMAPPAIAKFRTGVDSNNIPQYKYYVVVSSGVNNQKNDGTKAGGALKYNNNVPAPGAIFLLSLDKPASEAWSAGTNYYKIQLPAPLDGKENGVGPPALVLGADGAVRYAYVGDLQGNLWRLNFTGNSPGSTAAVLPSTTTPLFSARGTGTTPNIESITMQPKVVFAPNGGYVVLFGSGKLIENADLDPTAYATQSFYAIYDSTASDYKVAGRADLAPRTLTNVTGADGYTVSGTTFSYSSGSDFKKGWYVDFPDALTKGERSISNALIRDGQVLFNTLIPGSDNCAASSGRSYSFDALTGLGVSAATGYLSSIGPLSAPVVLQIGDPTQTSRNAFGKIIATNTTAVLQSGSGNGAGPGIAASGSGAATATVGRFSWREILNWQELRSATP